MIANARTILTLAMCAAASAGCSTSEIAGAAPADAPAISPAATSSLDDLSGATPPVLSTDMPHAPLQTMGGAYASTMWVDTPENKRLLNELMATRTTPETIHTTINHVHRTMTVAVGCAPDRVPYVMHDTWCDYSLDNRNNEPYRVSATTTHQYRHNVGGMRTRGSASAEREYRPAAIDTIVRKDSVQDPTGPGGGGAPRGGGGGSGGTSWTICWDYYALDLTTGDVTLLFTTCPYSPGGYTQGTSPAGVTMRTGDTANEGTLVGVSALLVQVPSLPRGAKVMVQRTRRAEHPYLILGVADASDSDWAGGIEVVKAIVRRDGPDAPPATFALGAARGKSRPEQQAHAATLRTRMQSARHRPIAGFGQQRAVPLTLFIER